MEIQQIIAFIDDKKVIYDTNHLPPDGYEIGDEVEHSDSEWNEALDYIIDELKKL